MIMKQFNADQAEDYQIQSKRKVCTVSTHRERKTILLKFGHFFLYEKKFRYGEVIQSESGHATGLTKTETGIYRLLTKQNYW